MRGKGWKFCWEIGCAGLEFSWLSKMVGVGYNYLGWGWSIGREMLRMRFSKKYIPPCPDADRYVLVRTKEGVYWRRKRGSIRKAVLNAGMQRSAEAMKRSAPAARRIMTRLRAFADRMEPGRLNAKISARLRKQLYATGAGGLSCLQGLDLQSRFPLERLLRGECFISVKDGMLKVHIPIRDYTVQRNSKLVSGYVFELILMYGDCMVENGLRVESETSPVFSFDQNDGECKMQMVLPEKEWMVLLKVNCVEGKEMAKGPRNYGMKVVAAGN